MADRSRSALLEEDEDRIDFRPLLRFAAWGMGALIAFGLAVLVGSSEVGKRRAAVALAAITSIPEDRARTASAAVPSTRANEKEQEGRRLSEAIRALDSERAQLVSRVSLLENRLEDLTGSISLTQPARRPATAAISAIPPAAPNPEPVAKEEPAPPPPIETPPPAAAPLIQAPERPAAAPNAALTAPANVAADAPPAPPTATLADVPLPRPNPNTVKPKLGVDLGAAGTIEGARTLWGRLKESQSPLLAELKPLVSIRESARAGGRAELRLVAGPIASAGAAARLCAALAASGISCRTTTFDGQRLAAQ